MLKIFIALLSMMSVATTPAQTVISVPTIGDTRVIRGHYEDYATIVTDDGNMWMIDGEDYFSEELKNYVFCWKDKEFTDLDNLHIQFDTKGTESVLDDEIINIQIL